MKKSLRIIAAVFAAALLGRTAGGVSFPEVLPGARPNGIGYAYTALADDPFALFYNPAGLADKKFLEASGDIGRRFLPGGSVAQGAAVYSRPIEEVPTGVFSFGWFGMQQDAVASKDVFAFSWARKQAWKLPPAWKIAPYGTPRWGVNARLISLRTPAKNRFGVGVDGGVIIPAMENFNVGLSMMELQAGTDLPTPAFNLGLAYDTGILTLAGDLRVRSGLSVFYPGVEAKLFEGLLKVRMGKGLALGQVRQLAFGLGVDLSPWAIDASFSLPTSAANAPGGSFLLSAGYRFGATPFHAKFLGRASERALDLDKELQDLEKKRQSLQDQVRRLDNDKTLQQEELKSLNLRAQEMKDRVRILEQQKQESAHPETPASPPVPKAEPKPAPIKAAEQWPKKHIVFQGDTLRSLSERYYRDPTLWDLIYQANPGKIERGLPNVGAELVIPKP
ncbi:MAG: hypothetical protein HY611_01305 [Elusimicrobia bacterium]|nr:hypothetical protein [Elusimicrobiota bacterium]